MVLKTPPPTGLLKRKRRSSPKYRDFPVGSLLSLSVDAISVMASFLDPVSLARTLDRTSNTFRNVIDHCSLWMAHFQAHFGVFQMSEVWLEKPVNPRDLYAKARKKLSGFRLGMDTPTIHRTKVDSEVIYLNCVVKLDELALLDIHEGIYIEIVVQSISDNLSLCLVDFDGDGSSSLTFSPDAGAVIRERRREEDGALVGAFTAALSPCKEFGSVQDSRVALFISKEQHIVFMRSTNGVWESTGPICGFEWVEGGLLTPCVAFRQAGEYVLRIHKVCRASIPPFATRVRAPLVWKPLLWLTGADDEDIDDDEEEDQQDSDDEVSEVEEI